MRSTLLMCLAILAVPTDASAAPAPPNSPVATPARAVPAPAALAATGTITGNLVLNSPIADPTWKGTCADMNVVARSSTTRPITVKGAGTFTYNGMTQHCTFQLTAPVGTWSLDFEIGGKSLLVQPLPPREVKKGETLTTSSSLSWPTEPIGNVSGTWDVGQYAACTNYKVTIVHPLRTFNVSMTQDAPGKCGLYSTNIPHGTVTVTVVGQPVQPQTGTISPATPVFTPHFVWPQFADVGVRLRPANYPANQVINCTPYEVVFKNNGVVATTVKPGASAAYSISECTFGTGPSVPAAASGLTLEVKKDGVVVKTQPVGPFTAKQHFEVVVQPLP